MYYLLQVRDISAGHFLEGDSIYFDEFKDNLLKEKVTMLRDEKSVLNGPPVLRFDAESKEESIFYKTINVVRGNRVYTLMVLGHVSGKKMKGRIIISVPFACWILREQTGQFTRLITDHSAARCRINLYGQLMRKKKTAPGFIIPVMTRLK